MPSSPAIGYVLQDWAAELGISESTARRIVDAGGVTVTQVSPGRFLILHEHHREYLARGARLRDPSVPRLSSSGKRRGRPPKVRTEQPAAAAADAAPSACVDTTKTRVA